MSTDVIIALTGSSIGLAGLAAMLWALWSREKALRERDEMGHKVIEAAGAIAAAQNDRDRLKDVCNVAKQTILDYNAQIKGLMDAAAVRGVDLTRVRWDLMRAQTERQVRDGEPSVPAPAAADDAGRASSPVSDGGKPVLRPPGGK